MSTGIYLAKVTSVDDPEQRGRIRVTSVELMGDEEEEIPYWIEPAPPWGWFFVPDVGELVEIQGIEGLPEDEQFHQTSIDSPDLKWRACVRIYGNSKAEEGATPVPDVFKTNYGKRRGFATPAGHVLMFDDSKGGLEVALTWTGPAGASSLTFDTTGKILLKVYAGQEISIDPTSSTVKVVAPNVVVESPSVDLGGGATDFALMANAFLNMFAGHIHPTGMGPSGPPTAGPAQPITPWQSAISGVVKVKA